MARSITAKQRHRISSTALQSDAKLIQEMRTENRTTYQAVNLSIGINSFTGRLLPAKSHDRASRLTGFHPSWYTAISDLYLAHCLQIPPFNLRPSFSHLPIIPSRIPTRIRTLRLARRLIRLISRLLRRRLARAKGRVCTTLL